MSDQLVLIDREALLAELRQAFDPRTAEVMLGVLDKVAAQVRAMGVTREDFTELKQIVAELAAAQQRTEQRLEELVQAQARSEDRFTRVEDRLTRVEDRLTRVEEAVEKLAAAQARSEERLTRLELAVEKLTQAQARSEERLTRVELAVEKLTQAQARSEERLTRVELAVAAHTEAITGLKSSVDQLRKQVGGLSETVGGDIEDIAYIVLYDVLKREFGWQVGVLERSWQTWDGGPEEVDVFGTAVDPARPDTKIWIVGEAKHNLTVREVERFVQQVERARQHLTGEIFPVCFCYRARPEVQQMVQEAGLRLVFSYGKLV